MQKSQHCIIEMDSFEIRKIQVVENASLKTIPFKILFFRINQMLAKNYFGWNFVKLQF